MAKFAVIIAAAGKSSRFKAKSSPFGSDLQKKPYASLKGRAVWLHSAEKFGRRDDVSQILLVVSPEDRAEVERRFAAELAFGRVELIEGGAERFLSVENALNAVSDDVEFVAVHDAARPCVTKSELDRVFSTAVRTGAAILAAPVVGSLKRGKKVEREADVFEVPGEKPKESVAVESSVSRDMLWEAQTPQVFDKELLKRAYRERKPDFRPTDDSGLVEALGVDVAIVEGSRLNIKITSSEDLAIAEKFMEIVAKRDSDLRRLF